MTDFNSLLTKIDEAATLEEMDRQYAALREAALADRERFVQFIHAVPLDESNNLIDVYEALIEEPEPWKQFLLEEIDRLWASAHKTPEAAPIILAPLDAMGLLGGDQDDSLQREVRARLKPMLGSEQASVRRLAVQILGDLTYREDRTALYTLKDLLDHDPDWKVRFFAYQALIDIDMFPPGKKLSLMDRLRFRFLNPYAM